MKLKLFAFAAIMTVLVACKKDDNNEKPEPKPLSSGYDQLAYFQNSIVKIDSKNDFIGRVYGVPLDKSDTTVISIGVDNIDEARDIFNGWLTEEVKLSGSNSDANGVTTVKFKDENGLNTGVTATFTPKVEENMVAQVSFTPVNKLHHLSKINFITKSSWPNNAESPYRKWEIEKYPTFKEGMQNWVCVREASAGVPGLLVYLSKERGRVAIAYQWDYADPQLAREVSRVFRSDWNTYSAFFANSGHGINQGGTGNWDAYYWIQDWHSYLFAAVQYGICLKTGDVTWFDIGYLKPNKNYMQVRTFHMID